MDSEIEGGPMVYTRMKWVRAHRHTCANVQLGSTYENRCDCGALDTAGNAIEVPRSEAAEQRLSAIEGGAVAEFGNGTLGVDTGTVHGKPAVFIRPLDHSGPVGKLLPEEKQVKGPQQSLERGEVYLTFPTMEQADRVADALVTSALTHPLPPAAEDVERMREALEIIAGKRQCLDNLMSNQDVALAALAQKEKRS